MIDFGIRLKEDPHTPYKRTPLEYYKELFLNPGLVPPLHEVDTELAARMIPYMKKFPNSLPCLHDMRPIRDLSALWFLRCHSEQLPPHFMSPTLFRFPIPTSANPQQYMRVKVVR